MFSLRVLLVNTREIFSKNCFSSATAAEKTSLYDFHVKNGGKMVNFGGFLLPVQYSDQSIVNSHLWTRKNASIFDVSHMLQTEIRGKNCIEFFESLCTADIQNLAPNAGTLTVFTNQNGGILDDLIVTKIAEDHLYVVSNAAMKKQDQEVMLQGLHSFKKINTNSEDITIRFFEPSEKALLALQGPKAAEALQKLTDVKLKQLYFMNSTIGKVASVDCRITRCGYTGEDGFEISMPAEKAQNIAQIIMKNNDGQVKMAGLGARDSLRLEAGLCLYGNDIDSKTTPVEGALTWLVAKRRREQKNFPGADPILRQIKEGSQIKRIGLTSLQGPPARQGAKCLTPDNQEGGQVTSGCPSPSLGVNIAMGYVPTELSKVGTKLPLKIREKVYEAVVTKMPFVKANYYNKPKA